MTSNIAVPVGDTRALPAALREGDVVRFIAGTTSLQPDPSPNGDNTSLNLVSGDDDYCLHLSFRRADKSVRLNSRKADGGWGTEESFKFDQSFTDGRPSVVSVTLRGNKFLIAVDGNLRYTYTQRLSASVRGVRYARTGDMTTQMFGDSVNVQVFHTSPPPRPAQSFSLSIGDTHALSSAVADNQFVYFNSSTTSLTPDSSPNGDNTSLNLLSADGDWLLHISIRRGDNTIAFNARGATSGWGSEERISSQGFFRNNEPASVVVQNKSAAFDIYFEGVLRYSFKKRINLPARAVRYHRNSDMSTQIFADTISVAVDGQ